MMLEVRLMVTFGGIPTRGQGEVLGVMVLLYFLIWLCECIHTKTYVYFSVCMLYFNKKLKNKKNLKK